MNEACEPSQLDELKSCPVPVTHRRLRHCHMLWHQAMDRYHEAEQFRANLNATIEALRTVSFMLQNEKGAFGDFDKWYEPWRTRLKNDSFSRWLNDARVTVVHQQDLDSYSVAEIRLLTYEQNTVATIPIPIHTSPSVILENPALLALFNSPADAGLHAGSGALLVERKWSTKELGGKEILSALAHVYGLLADMVLNAHSHLGRMDCIPAGSSSTDFPLAYDRTGVLRCMYAGAEQRTQRFVVSTKQEAVPRAVEAPHVDPKVAIERYGLDELFPVGELEQLDPVAIAERFVHISKRIMRRDKCHQRMMFIRDGKGTWQQLVLTAKDRTEKHIFMQLIAQFVEAQGCDALIEISEVWTAQVPFDKPLMVGDVENIPGRTEELAVLVATRDGLQRTYLTPIKRGRFGGIKLGDTIRLDNQHLNYLRPVIEVWIRQQTFRAQDGTQSRTWEPDALDLCPCGGPNRYAECCREKRISLGRDGSSEKLHKALADADLKRAETIARASLAQYVIWIKQHTAPALYSGAAGKEFYEQIVTTDVLALQSHVQDMIFVLSAAGKEELILPQLRRLREIVGVPTIAMRLVAMAASWLFESGRSEEGVLELDALGRVEDVSDSLALALVARFRDLSPAKSKGVLTRAIEVATCDEERQLARLDLARYLAKNAEADHALVLVRLLLSELGSTASPEVESAALILLWTITNSNEDFQAAYRQMQRDEQFHYAHRNAIYLIDHGKYPEAECILRTLVEAGDVEAKVLLVDSRIRSGASDSAFALFTSIQPDSVPEKLKYPYAVAASLLALAGCSEVRGQAIALLQALPPTDGEQQNQVTVLLESLG